MSETRIFVIHFENNKRYLLESELLSTEIVSYLEQSDIDWVKQNLPISLVGVVSDNGNNLDKYVVKYMQHVGIDLVRGGKYTNPVLSNDEIKEIKKNIRKKNILCRFIKKIIKKIAKIFKKNNSTSTESSFNEFSWTTSDSDSETDDISNL